MKYAFGRAGLVSLIITVFTLLHPEMPSRVWGLTMGVFAMLYIVDGGE